MQNKRLGFSCTNRGTTVSVCNDKRKLLLKRQTLGMVDRHHGFMVRPVNLSSVIVERKCDFIREKDLSA